MKIPFSACLIVYVYLCVFPIHQVLFYQQDDFFVCAVFKTTILHLKYFYLMVIIISFYKASSQAFSQLLFCKSKSCLLLHKIGVMKADVSG